MVDKTVSIKLHLYKQNNYCGNIASIAIKAMDISLFAEQFSLA